MLDRSVLAFKPGRIIIKGFVINQAIEDICYYFRVRMKITYRIAYIFLFVIAKSIELGLVGPDDHAVPINPVKWNGSVFEKIREFINPVSEFFVFPLINQKLFLKFNCIFHADSTVILNF